MQLQELKTYLNCDDDFLRSLIEKYVEEVSSISETIKTAAEANNWPAVKMNAHKMLSSVRIFEITGLVSLLEKIEIGAEQPTDTEDLRRDIYKMLLLAEHSVLDMRNSLAALG